MSDTFQVVGGPPIVLDDGTAIGFGEVFDLDELADDDLLRRLLDSGQIIFVIPVADEMEDESLIDNLPPDGDGQDV